MADEIKWGGSAKMTCQSDMDTWAKLSVQLGKKFFRKFFHPVKHGKNEKNEILSSFSACNADASTRMESHDRNPPTNEGTNAMKTVTFEKIDGFGITARNMPADQVDRIASLWLAKGWKVSDVRDYKPAPLPTWEAITCNGRYSCD